MRGAAQARIRKFGHERTMRFCPVTPMNHREWPHELGNARMNSGAPA